MNTLRKTMLCPILVVLITTVGLHTKTEAADERRVVVEIQGSKFVPAKSAVRLGDTVVWRNLDIVPHTATAKDASWDSALIPPSGEWEMMVSEDTRSDYYCVFHPSMIAVLEISSQ